MGTFRFEGAGRFSVGILLGVAILFGQEPGSVKAGDNAPEVNWSSMVQAPDAAKYRPTLTGLYTVITFLPNVTANARAVDRWNDLMAKFRNQPVQFVWIASEKWPVVEPFLKQHPMDGWLLVEQNSETAKAFGCEMGQDVIVDPMGRIVGFTSFLQPEQLSAVLQGKAGTVVHLDREPHQWTVPGKSVKPDVTPSWEVHISPSATKGTEAASGPDFWVRKGFDLRAIVAMVYKKDPSRVVLPKALDNEDKFDFIVVLPAEASESTIDELVQRAIEKQFHVAAVAERKPVDVYVMTALKGRTPAAKAGSEGLGGGTFSSSGFAFLLPEGTAPTPEAMEKATQDMLKHADQVGLSNVSAENTTLDEFGSFLETGLGRPVLNETGLEGVYELVVHGDAKDMPEFIRMLREQTGLVLTSAMRTIEFVTLRPLE